MHQDVIGERLLQLAIDVPEARRHLIEHDDRTRGGERNPVKRWWFDLEIVDGVAVAPRAGVNERDLDPARAGKLAAGQKLAFFPPELQPAGGTTMQTLVPMDRGRQSLTLALFGIAGVTGTLSGGLANDRFGPRRTLMVQLTVLGTAMALLPLTRGSWAALVAALMTWGVAGFGMMVPQQSRLAAMAPTQAPLLLSLNTSMLYLGTAAGAMVGGAAANHLGLVHLAWAAVPFVALALAIVALVHTSGPAVRVDRKEKAE